MPDYLRGSAPTIYARPLSKGLPVDGPAVSVSVRGPDGSVLSSGYGEYLGGGLYGYQLPSLTSAGGYLATWYLEGSPVLMTPFTVGYPTAGSSTLREVRRMLSLVEMGDCYEGVVSSSTPTSVLVPALAGYPDGHFNGGYVALFDEAGLYQERPIVNSAAGTLSVSGWDYPPYQGQLAEVHIRFPVRSYNEAIRRAQLGLRDRVYIPILVEKGLERDGEADLPADLAFLCSVSVEGVDLPHEEVARDGSGWRLRPGAVAVPGYPAGTQVSLSGLGRLSDPLHESSLVEVSPDYLIYKAAASLLRSRSGGPSTDADANLQRSLVYESLADKMLFRISTGLAPGMRRVL